jgi:hypothetical protein
MGTELVVSAVHRRAASVGRAGGPTGSKSARGQPMRVVVRAASLDPVGAERHRNLPSPTAASAIDAHFISPHRLVAQPAVSVRYIPRRSGDVRPSAGRLLGGIGVCPRKVRSVALLLR